MNKFDWSKGEVIRVLKGTPGTMYQESNDNEKAIFRDWIRGLLQKQPVVITFVKADGSLRDMQCTLDYNRIPLDKQPQDVPVENLLKESKKRREPDPHVLRVFDIEKNEWRSFRFDRLKKITAEINFE